MSFTSSYRIFRLGLMNFWRNRWLSLAATLMMTLTLLIISFFAVLNLGVKNLSEALRNRIDVEVYFYEDNVPDEKIFALRDQLNQKPEIASIRFISKEEAKKRWENMDFGLKGLKEVIDENNPLPRSLLIKTRQPEQIRAIVDFLHEKQFSNIVCSESRCINYNQEKNRTTVEKLTKITRFTQSAGLVIGIIFVFVSILIILNTIRMTIFTRRDEIEVMKLVGASHAFIRYPFIIETIFYGFFATILSLIIISLSIKFTSPYVSKYLIYINLDMLKFFKHNLWTIIGLQLAISLIVSVICGLLTIRKYLKT